MPRRKVVAGISVTIEEGYPMPNPGARGSGVSQELRALKRGQSALVSGMNQKSVSSIAHQVFGRSKYVTQKLRDGSERVRVWRR